MRILALETDIEVIRRLFTAEGEKVLHSCHNHFASMLSSILQSLGLMAVTVTLIFLLYRAETEEILLLGILPLISILAMTVFYLLLRGWIQWRYNGFIVTEQKVIVVRHLLMFKQEIIPIHLENIASTRVESQFLKIFNVGKISVNLKEREEASTRLITVPYIPDPNRVCGEIENAIVLLEQRKTGEISPEEQERRLEHSQKQ